MALSPKIGNFSPRFFLDKIFIIDNAVRGTNDWYALFILTECYNEILILIKSYTHLLKTAASSVLFLKLKLKITLPQWEGDLVLITQNFSLCGANP